MELKDRMLEKEMELYLRTNNYQIEDEEGCTDSVLVCDHAADLGFKSYTLEGHGELNQTLLFVMQPQLKEECEMNKSTVDKHEFTVVTRPFYREQKPSYRTVLASDVEEAIDMVWRPSNDVKEILDAKPSAEIIWNEETINYYWNMYR